MKGRIPENLLEDILSRTDIVEVISGYIPLKRAGRNFKALCPFHHEKTASFMVSPDRQIYHCFGCGESGNAFKFLMSYERLEFPEAVELLAKKAGVIIPEIQKQDERDSGVVSLLYKINELAGIFYQNNLNSSLNAKTKDYLLKRGLKNETIKLFRIGFAPDRWDALMNYLREKNFGLSLIERAGLIISKEGGGYYDRFRNRIIFPVTDIKSRIIGFGARVLDNSLPKYVNSPETPVYIKGRNLFGLNLAKDSIREEDCVVIVEGYLDLIIPFQEGLKNIVATSGTALTIEQARLLKRYTANAVIVYDPDLAGELATLRSLDIFIEEGMNVRIATLPQGLDPDLYVRKNGVENFRERIKNSQNLFDYKLNVLKSRYNYREIEGKAKICALILETINKIRNSILKSEYVKKLAQELDVREEALLQEMKKIKDDRVNSEIPALQNKQLPGINPTEKLLIKLMLEERDLIEKIKQSIEPADFQDERTARIVSIMFDLIEGGHKLEPNSLMNYLGEEDMSNLVCESIFLPEIPENDKEKVVNDCIRRLKNQKLRSRRERLHEQIRTAQNSGDEEKLQKLIEEFHSLIKKGKEHEKKIFTQ